MFSTGVTSRGHGHACCRSHTHFPFMQSVLNASLSTLPPNLLLGFLTRPLGAFVFGRIGDKYGRKTALILSIYVMCIPTVLVGCLPTYYQAGIVAPVLLCILRAVQVRHSTNLPSFAPTSLDVLLKEIFGTTPVIFALKRQECHSTMQCSITLNM